MVLATLAPGTYVLAVSGGVDSMALLDLLAGDKGSEPASHAYVVAHFDHGIRADSAQDRALVQAAAQRYDLPFIYEEGHLGAGASEATARAARYAFLHKVRQQYGAAAIVTAHHQDDVVETAMLNMLRGTGRKGLSSLRSTPLYVRPLFDMPKEAIRAYAQAHGVQWREDSTNADDTYARNYLRRHIVPRMSAAQREAWLAIIATSARLNTSIDTLLAPFTAQQLDRQQFIMLPHTVSREVMAAWLRRQHAEFDRKRIERLVAFAKTAAPGKLADVDGKHILEIGKEYITLLANPSNRCV